MWTYIDTFLSQIASTLGYPRESLSLVAELRTGGPTVQPGAADAKFIEKLVTVKESGDASKLPSPWYDTLGSKHIEYRIVMEETKGAVTIPRTLYSFQHHVMPGNCRICVNRWVQVLDEKKWPEALKHAGLVFRARIAKHAAMTRVLLITTGSSFAGAEPYDAYEKIFEGEGRKIYALTLDKFFASQPEASA